MGIVTEVGSKAGSHFKVGDRAGIGCFVRACQVSPFRIARMSHAAQLLFRMSLSSPT